MADKYTDERFGNVDGVIRKLIDEVIATQRELAANRQTTAQALAAIMARIERLEERK
jgi:hypothetical protein